MQSRIDIFSLILASFIYVFGSGLYAQQSSNGSHEQQDLDTSYQATISEFEIRLNQTLGRFISGYDRFIAYIDTNNHLAAESSRTSIDVHFLLIDTINHKPTIEVAVPGFSRVIQEMSQGNFEFSKELLFNTVVGIFISRIPREFIQIHASRSLDQKISEYLNISDVFGFHPQWRSITGTLWNDLRNAINYYNQSYRTNYQLRTARLIKDVLLLDKERHLRDIFYMFQTPSSNEYDYPRVLSVILSETNSMDQKERVFRLLIPIKGTPGKSDLAKMLLASMLQNLRYSPYSSPEFFPAVDVGQLACQKVFSIRSDSRL